ncbi:hypothetical protein HPP92_021309 [Vanilla planifolia]|uniref:Uncharacterized protein n=1 Tax=Vanilla planifolia TaxID=51239 RepID=A0A835Q0U6_VANPL|nr:hypothetical protein HPP92_021309 [Vanilla planifolia]
MPAVKNAGHSMIGRAVPITHFADIRHAKAWMPGVNAKTGSIAETLKTKPGSRNNICGERRTFFTSLISKHDSQDLGENGVYALKLLKRVLLGRFLEF